MQVINNFKFLQDVEIETTSQPYINVLADTLTLDVNGDASGIKMVVEGKTDINSEQWIIVSGINLSNYDLVSEITNNGLYLYPMSGLSSIRVKLNNILTGQVNAFGRIVASWRY